MSIARFFKVLPDEGSKVLTFALLAGLLQMGVAIGMVAADSMFLSQLGVKELPLVFIAMPLVMAIYAPIYSALVAWLGPSGLFKLTLLLLVIGGGIIGFGADYWGEQRAYLFAAKIYAGLWFIALYTLFWNLADDYFSTQDGKRLFGLISAGSSAGAMLGGALVTALAGTVPTGKLFLLWSAAALLTWPCFLIALARFKPIDQDSAVESAPSSLRESLNGLGRALSGSRFAMLIAAICFAMVALSSLLEYLSMGIFAEARSAADLAQLLGGLHAIAGAATLVINLFFFNRLIGWIGVGSTALVVPSSYLAMFILFFLAPGLPAAIVAFFAFQTLFVAIEYNNINLLYNALPNQTKRQLRTFVEAFAEPLASATAGVALFYASSQVESSAFALAGLMGAVLAVAIALWIRTAYLRSLSINLRADWLDFANPRQLWLAQWNEGDARRLRELAVAGERSERLLAVDLLWRLGDVEARRVLLDFLTGATVAEAEQLRPAIAGLLLDHDTRALAETLLWLESEAAPQDPEVLETFTSLGAFPVRQFSRWQQSSEPSHRAAIAAARWHGSKLEDSESALRQIKQLLAGDAAARRMGIRALGDFREARFSSEILSFLVDPDAATRLEAFRALNKIASPATPQIIQQLSPHLRRADDEERLIILDIARRVGDASSVADLLWAAEYFSSAENRRLESFLSEMGLKCIPQLIQVAREPAAPFHARSLAVRGLARLSLAQLLLIADDLLDQELGHAEQALAAHRALRPLGGTAPGQAILTRYYRDAAAEGLVFVLELLSLTGKLPDFEMIRAMLSFANARDRANAIETIEQSCSRALFARIQGLIQSTVSDSGLLESRASADLDAEQVLRMASDSNVPLEVTAGILALHEAGIADGPALVKQRLEQRANPRLSESFIGLLGYFAARKLGDRETEHPLHRLHSLSRAAFFGESRITAIDFLAQHGRWQRWAPGEQIYAAGQVADSLFVVSAGEVTLQAQGRAVNVGAGMTFGQRVLMGEQVRAEDARSAGCECVLLGASTVMRAIEVFPSLGVGLYQFKTQPALAL